MKYPVSDYKDKWYIASDFGENRGAYFHNGCDLNLKTGGDTDLGQPLFAVNQGKIVYYHLNSHPTTGYGKHNVLECDTPFGKRWFHYAHCLEIVSSIKEVNEGEEIAKLGKSGTKLAHCHFACFKVDPKSLRNGIDTIAKTEKELSEWWEDPIKFIEKCLQEQPLAPAISDDEQNALVVVKEAFNTLKKDDKYKEGNLEGYVRGITAEHLKFEEYETDSLQLNGFISKWAEKWDLKDSDDLVEIENEMSKLLTMEDTLSNFRKAIEKAVGNEYSDDKALLKALEAIKDDKEAIEEDLSEATLKLSNRKIIKAFTFLGYLIKVYEKKKTETN
jgi:hypothetical protein